MKKPIGRVPVVHCRDKQFRRYLSPTAIRRRVADLGAEITRDYAGREPVIVGVLTGGCIFLADLVRAIALPCEIDFVKLSSYGDRQESSRQVKELKRTDIDVRGRDVIVVEDIVDTGLSLQFLLVRLAEQKPASLRVAVCLHKPEAAVVTVPLDYVGFRIPNRFVIGYGLDYAQHGRNLPGLYILDDGAKPV